jgi:hypothetical protein
VIPGKRRPLQFLPDDSLLTHADRPEGVCRWPIQFSEEPNQTSIGEPISLAELRSETDPLPSLFAGLDVWDASQDGTVISTPFQRDPSGVGANIFLAEVGGTAYRRLELGRQHDVYFTSVSPDGRWVATGSISWQVDRRQAMDSVTVWESQTGRRVVDLLIGEGWPRFSPDGQWIAVTSGALAAGIGLWRVGTWEAAASPPPVAEPSHGPLAFDSQSQLLAVTGNPIRLLVPETGQELACLSVPEGTAILPQCFTPDATRLIALGIRTDQLYVWDLHAIRKELAEMDLDWDAPPYGSQ